MSFCGNSELWNATSLFDNWWPEFPECFQQTVIVLIPCGWLWITAVIYCLYMWKHMQFFKLPLSWVIIARLICSAALVFVTGFYMLLPTQSQADDVSYPPAFFFSKSVLAVSFLLATILMLLSQRCGVSSPCIIFIFWVLALISNIVPAYTVAIKKEYDSHLLNFSLVYITLGLLCLQVILQCIGETKFIALQMSLSEKPCPMMQASFPSKITFSWVFSMVYAGYKKNITIRDIFDVPPLLQSRNLVPEFMRTWLKELRLKKPNTVSWHKGRTSSSENRKIFMNGHTENPTEKTLLLPKSQDQKTDEDVNVKMSKPSLYKVLFKIFYLSLFKAQVAGLIGDMILFLNPVMLHQIINFAENKEDYPMWQGYFLSGVFFLVIFLNSLMNNYRFYTAMNIGVQVKTVLTAAVYKKALTMNAESRRKFTVGTIVNLMAVDCLRFQDLTSSLWVLVSWPVQISLAFYMLYTTLGIAFVAGIGVLLLLIPANARISTLTRRAQAEQITIKDQRIKLMNEILSGIKVLKLYAWEPSFETKIAEIRRLEVIQLKKAAMLQSINILCWLLSPVLVTVATFTTYVLISPDNTLTPEKAFVALNLFNMIKQPMNTLPMLISSIVQCHVSMIRLRDYLSGEDLEDVDTTASKEFPLSMKNATYTWDRSMPPVLKNISLQVPEGKLVAVVGQVGSGKSSLISAFLGEMSRLSGSGSIAGSVAYVPQQAWMQNMTLRNNILFEQLMEEKRYKKIVSACALEPDIELLPGGELTEIGEKGINLSGGQKQRISLARAVYQNADVYLLDDPLSAVDAHVGKHIFDKVLGPKGLIRKKTRILVTHGIHWLPHVDSIIVMDQGKITETGTFSQLMDHDGPFSEFVRTYLLTHEDEDADDPDVLMFKEQVIEQLSAVTSDEEQQVMLRRSISSTSEGKSTRVSEGSRTSLIKSSTDLTSKVQSAQQYAAPSRSSDRLIEDEKSAVGTIRSNVIMALLKAFGYVQALMIPVSLLVYNGFNVGSGIWLSEWTGDSYLKNESNKASDDYSSKTNEYLGIYVLLSLLQVTGNAAFILLVLVQFVNASQRLHNKMLANILHQPMAFFDTTPLGRILNRFSRDVDVVDVTLSRLLRMTLNTIFVIMSIIVVISYTTPIFLVVVVPILFVYVLFQKFYIPSSRQFRRLESVTRSPVYSHFAETINGASTIRAYRVGERFFLDSQNRVDTNNKCAFASASAARWLRVRLEILGNFIVLFSSLFAVISNDISGSLVGLSVTYALQVTNALNMMVQNATQLETNAVSVERIVEYFSLSREPDWVVNECRPMPDWPQYGQVEFKNYSTRYRPHLDLVLHSVSFTVKAGEKVGIVGRTGAGKSSLSLALFRVIEAAGGSILIDGLDISRIGLHDLRARLTILPQDPVLFSGTVRFNLDPFSKHSDEAVWEALQKASLSEFVADLPGRLDYVCEEGGQNLSVGQRQLMCLARSLLRKTKILVLDEATAAVDLETDALLQKTIRSAFKDCTVLTVAHRLKTVIDYDKIMVLSNGEIMEYDRPEALLSDTNSLFYSMAKESSLV